MVTNISGGGGSIGVAKMVSSKPDGTTLAGAWTGPISIAPHTLGVSYTPSDYIPVMLFSSAPYVICTRPDFPANTASELLDLLKKNPEKINWHHLSSNIEAIELLKENLHKINWRYLSENPNAIELLKENQDKINWQSLSSNPNAIELLKNNQDKINWEIFSRNTKIFF
jgi:hypothetical protein